MIRFINREEELAFLNQRYKSPKSEFIVIYGRRRIGKSELAKYFIKDKKAVYFLATRATGYDHLRKFLAKTSSLFNEYPPEIDSWERCFDYLKKKIKENFPKEKLVLVIDEFPYLIEANREIPSLFQLLWDEYLKEENILLILMGSSISMMETEVLGSKSPLYGRRTGQIKLAPFKFKDVLKFYPRADIKRVIEFYSVVGAIPMYILEFEEDKDVFANIENKILAKKELFNEEAEFLLKEELRDPATYQVILEAIATTSKASEIAQKAYLELHNLDKYLKVLTRLDLIRKESLVTVKKPKSKKIYYSIKDNFLDFWYKYCFPNASLREENPRLLLEKFIKINFNGYVGKKFEQICREFLWELNRLNKSPFSFTKIGRQWGKIPNVPKDKNQYEIDTCAINEQTKEILFGECKWQDQVDVYPVLNELKEKAKFVDWNNDKRKEYYAIFAKSFEKKIKEENLFLFDLKDLKRCFKV